MHVLSCVNVQCQYLWLHFISPGSLLSFEQSCLCAEVSSIPLATLEQKPLGPVLSKQVLSKH